MSNSNLVSSNIPAYEGNYTKGRSGRHIEAICLHHMAGRLTAEQCGSIFQQVGRCGSSHYGIGYDGKIAQYVDESDTAWTNSNWDSNCKSVTIETSDNDNSWYVNDTTLNSLIELVADIAKRNNLGTLVSGKNLTWHSMFTNTTCPGDYLRSKMQYIAEEANKRMNPITSIEEIERKSVRLKIDANLWNLNFVNPDNAVSVKQFKTGDVIDNIVAIAYHQSGCKYYLTEYSYSNNIMNGFNIVDCEDIVAEEPKEEPKEEEPVITPIPTPEPKPEEPEITENFIKRLIKAIIDFINKLLNK